MTTGKAALAGVMGWPVGHSLSPLLHNYWLERYGIYGAYVPLPVAPENLEAVTQALPRAGFGGWNVTVPHKEAMLALVDRVEPLAERVGAVNTVVVQEGGTLLGHNTDVYGFMENLTRQQPGWKENTERALVLGAGGAARAVIVGLQEAGVEEIECCNRSLDRAKQLVDNLDGGLGVVPWDEREIALEEAGLLVNTTSLGMEGQPPLHLALDALPETAIVYDIVYAPLYTPLLQTAKKRGNPVVTGLGMLMHQAVPGFAAWFGREPEVDKEIEQLLLRQLQE